MRARSTGVGQGIVGKLDRSDGELDQIWRKPDFRIATILGGRIQGRTEDRISLLFLARRASFLVYADWRFKMMELGGSHVWVSNELSHSDEPWSPRHSRDTPGV